jgi:hypothetical protein
LSCAPVVAQTHVQYSLSAVVLSFLSYRRRPPVPYHRELSTILSTILKVGHKWNIVTFGQPPVVSAYMSALGFTEDQYKVYSPLSGNQRYDENLSPPENKNELLALCAREAGGVENGQVLLLDDDRRNIHAARSEGFQGSDVRPGEGISTRLFIGYLERAAAASGR